LLAQHAVLGEGPLVTFEMLYTTPYKFARMCVGVIPTHCKTNEKYPYV
jgi:hypothetical protein